MSESHNIPKEFFDPEYLYAYAEDFLNTKIATQIRVLREQRGLTQEDLAQKIGTKQPGIARLENVNYSAWKIETLKKLAKALDVIYIGGFVSLSTFLREAERFSRKILEQPSFQDEIITQERQAKVTSVTLPHNSSDIEQYITIHKGLLDIKSDNPPNHPRLNIAMSRRTWATHLPEGSFSNSTNISVGTTLNRATFPMSGKFVRPFLEQGSIFISRNFEEGFLSRPSILQRHELASQEN